MSELVEDGRDGRLVSLALLENESCNAAHGKNFGENRLAFHTVLE
jgi:hypothetical protein